MGYLAKVRKTKECKSAGIGRQFCSIRSGRIGIEQMKKERKGA
jgi:hypothetical protein